MEKVSRYLVISDRAYRDQTGVAVRLLFATRTARMLCVLPAVAQALQAGEVAAIPTAWLSALREAQVIVPAGDDELTSVLDRNRRAAADPAEVQFILIPTSYCNMGCSYCGQEHTRGGVTSGHRDRVRARVLRAMALPTTRSLDVEWFGSEPMMGYAVIRDLAPSFVAAAAEHGIRYGSSIVTNGALLNARNIDVLVRKCGVRLFEVTLDGPPALHDAHRPLKSGKGSFWKIVSTIREAATRPGYEKIGWDIRTNADVHNQDSISEYIELMSSLGFALPNVSFSIARVRPWSNDVSAIELSRQQFADRELAWLAQMRRHGLSIGLLPRTARTITCPAVRRASELISSTGNVFSCTDHPLVPEAEAHRALGHISQPDLPLFRPAGEFDTWSDDVEQGKSWCRDCVFLPTCGGSCPKAWREGNPPCPGYKLNVQGRLDLVAADSGLQPMPAGA